MKRTFRLVSIAVILLWTLCAQATRPPESLNSWPYFKQIRPVPVTSGLFEVVLDSDVLNEARTDEADLRLYDNSGREIPYALRVRREVDVHDDPPSREFNQVVKNGTAQVSIDLGEQPPEHNQVLVQTAGGNFRRFAEVEGSSDGSRWSTLVSKAVLFRFSVDSRTVAQTAITYPVSRYRFLRVSVDRDPQTDEAAPEFTSVRVRRVVRMQAEYTQTAGSLAPREADRFQGREASIWNIDFGARIPLQRIVLAPAAGDYSRPYQLEIVDDPSAPLVVVSGELQHRDQPSSSPPALEFEERFARHLKLTIVDDRNEPLQIHRVTALGAARQLVFEPPGPDRGPLRLYYGNLKAVPPHYDLDTRIPANTVVPLTRLTLGPQRPNPTYTPEPKPLSERQPWVVYVVLLGACAVLAWLLLSIAREARVQTSPDAV